VHIGILSDPNNFHTAKWASVLEKAGAKITVFSFDFFSKAHPESVKISPPLSWGGKYHYLSYLSGGRRLKFELEREGIDVLNPLNITPFGVWGRKSGFRPMIATAFGADILDFPPPAFSSEGPGIRHWANTEGDSSVFSSLKRKLTTPVFRSEVIKTLNSADLITADNLHLVDCITRWFGIEAEKVKLLRWGVEPELFLINSEALSKLRTRFGIIQGQKVILSPRGANAFYQGDKIIEAFEVLLGKGNPDWKFIMLSAGYPVSKEVEEKAAKLEKKYSNFRFERNVLPREEVYGLWNLVEVFISAPVYDGYSASLAEGRFSGAIPLVNNIRANTELITHLQNGWVVQAFSVEELASDLEYIMANSNALRERFGPENKNWILKNSLIDQNAHLFLEWCENLLK
jgi:glycosyltransferase involved in cell wall biosynthesis